MKDKTKTQTKEMNSLNKFISKINNVTFITLLLVYSSILLLVVVLISPKYNYLITPTKDHLVTDINIRPQITLKNNYVYVDEKLQNKTTILAKLIGEKNEGVSDPNITINSFKLSAYTTGKRIEYFTEQSGYKTPITHTYTLNDDFADEFYVNIKYKDQGVEKNISCYENIWLKVGSNTYQEYVSEKPSLYIDLDNGFRVEMRATENTSKNTYSVSLRVGVKDVNKDYHIDVQTFLVPEDNSNYTKLEERPLVGIYGFASDTTNYVRVDDITVSKENADITTTSYIYCKLFYYETSLASPKEVYYKFKINDILNKTFSTSWTNEDVSTEDIPEEENHANNERSIIIACTSVVIAGAITCVIYVIYNKKRNKKLNNE